ncbi:MAG: 16S rRNA (cytidine(1402)-2'-O)-methyltransferase [Pseudomonadota bacterium]
MAGTLYVVATPIGNLADLTPRGRTTLSETAIIACEDTRRLRKLMSLLGLTGPAGQRLVACHEHSEAGVVPQLIEALQSGADVALVSDAGTPLLSDPGHLLVKAAWQAALRVVPVPGPSAVLTLLSACPLPAMPWAFHGFLPTRGGRRRSQLSQLLARPEATVLFESPHRILQTLEDLAELAPERPLFLGRELTKRYEHFYLGTATELAAQLQAADAARGEFALLISAALESDGPVDPAQHEVFKLLVQELGPSRAAKLMAKLSERSRSELYDEALRLRGAGKDA